MDSSSFKQFIMIKISFLRNREIFILDGINNGRWPDWLLEETPRNSDRYKFTTHRYYTREFPLVYSGLLDLLWSYKALI